MSALSAATPQAPVPSLMAVLREAFQDRNRLNSTELEPAVEALGFLGDPRAVPVLLTALEDGPLRASAAEALGALRDRRAVRPLILALGQGSGDGDRRTAQALGAIGARAIRLLDAAFRLDRRRSRAAAEALRGIGPPAVEPLIAALGQASADVQECAIGALGAIGDARAVEPLLAALGHEAEPVRAAAAGALGALRDPRAVERLVAALDDEAQRVRTEAADALGCLGVVEPLAARLPAWWVERALSHIGAPAVPALLLALEHGTAEVRAQAVRALLPIRDGRAIARLIALLDETSEGREPGLREVLDRLRPARAVLPLLAEFGQEDAGAHARAAVSFGQSPPAQVVPLLIDALDSDVDWIANGAVRALGAIGTPAIRPLLRLLRAGIAAKRAASALAIIGAPAVRPLIQILRTAAPWGSRSAAVHALALIRDPRAAAPLRAAIRDENAFVRRDAMEAVAASADARAVPALIAALDHESLTMRPKALRALGAIGEPAVRPLLRRLGDASLRGRCNAGRALGAIGARAVGPLVTALQGAPAARRARVAEALGYAADPAAVPSLLDLLRDGKATVRATAAWALGRISDPRSVAPLLAALDDGVPEVRAEAVAALGRQGDGRAVEPLVRRGRGESAWSDAVDALCAIGAPAVGPLIVALEDPAPWIRAGAAQGLGRIGDARAIGPLSVALRDPEASVRGEAADALGWIGDPRAVPALIGALSDEDHGGEAPVRMLRALQAIGRPAAEALKTARETADSQVQRRIDFALREIPHV